MAAQAMVLPSALATIEFIESPVPSLSDHTTVVQVPSDGLCMWSCLYLACCTPAQLYATCPVLGPVV
jgi:hypothetical protein